ncbi:MAG: DUF3048 domain-containing protein [Lachnospiraceae bacterium]|nr:DUF3048 domain-containing protein [Lachnospiraceae bacterium]
MKKRSYKLFGLGLALALVLSACGDSEEQKPDNQQVVELNPAQDGVEVSNPGGTTPADSGEPEEEEQDVIPEGMYRSELSNEIISKDLENLRPIAVMVDNEITALPHYGTSEADIVYEMMNSTANGRITRLMCVMKDWKNIKQLGSIRSTRPTNVMVAAEYNAILIHDGGPYYIYDYINKDYTDNLSSGFGRFPNGKSMEYTEYVTYDTYKNPETGAVYDGLQARIDKAGYSETYTSNYEGPHFQFTWKDQILSKTVNGAFEVRDVKLPFPHNQSELHYNGDTKLYEYYEYGKKYEDAGNNNAPLAFKNVIIMKCSFHQYDAKGYLIYNILVGQPWEGYLLQSGEAVKIGWQKLGEKAQTIYTYEDGTPITLNTGKTYIAIVPDDSWNTLELK